jgi:Leucine-rich repeat (LRR) protein
MTDEELLQIIKQAAREGATELDLSDDDLKVLPLEICQLDNLSVLDLRKNKLTAPHKSELF